MNHHCKKIIVGVFLWSSSIILSIADPTPPEAPKKPETPGFEATATEIKLPGVTINRAAREVRIDAEVCLDSGLLEYVVCRPETFEHESIFTTKAKPELVHAALLLCGMKPTPLMHGLSELWSEKAMKQKLSRVKIEVEWEQEKKKKRVNLTSLIRSRQDHFEDEVAPAKDKPKKEEVIEDAWIFTGSFLHVNRETGKQFYAANSSGILIGIWPDPSTVIQYGIMSGDPYQGEHLGMEIHEENTPKVGTKVKLVFSLLDLPAKKEDAKKEQPKK